MRPHSRLRNVDVGERLDISPISEIFDYPKEHNLVKLECGYHFRSKNDVCQNDIWVGSYLDVERPYSVMVSRADGSSKRETDITRVGNDLKAQTELGQARVALDLNDLIVICVSENDFYKTAFLRIVGFDKTDNPNRNVLTCETLKLDICDDEGLSTVYTHDTDNLYLRYISEDVQDSLVEKSQVNTTRLAKWYDVNLERFSYIKRPIRCKLNFTGKEDTTINVELEDVYEQIDNFCKEFHKESKSNRNRNDPVKDSFFFGRVPLKVYYYTKEMYNEVIVTLVAPYTTKMMLVISEENFSKLGLEPLIAFRASNFNDFYNIVEKEKRENNRAIVVDRIFRL